MLRFGLPTISWRTEMLEKMLDGTTSDSYLLYTNRSRADALAGSFSKLKRNLVEGEAVASLAAILLQTRLNLESSSMNQAGSPPRSGKPKIIDWLFGGTRLLWWLMTIIVLIALFGLSKRNSKRNAASFERETIRRRALAPSSGGGKRRSAPLTFFSEEPPR